MSLPVHISDTKISHYGNTDEAFGSYLVSYLEDIDGLDADILDTSELSEDKIDLWLRIKLRRKCFNRISEIRINKAMSKQLKKEALRMDVRAEEAEGKGEDLADMHSAKADTLREEAAVSLGRANQALLELRFLAKHGEVV